MNSSAALEIIISTLALGSLYCLMSMGLTLTFSTLQLFNFSHGALMMFAAYLGWLVANSLGVKLPIALLLAVVGSFMLSLLIEKTIIRGLMKKGLIEVIIGTLAIALLLENIVLFSFGGRLKRLPVLIEGGVRIGGGFITYNNIAIAVISLLILLGMFFFLKHSKYGMAMRAVSQDKEASQIVGIGIGKVNMFVFGLSGTLAGIAGVFLGTIYMMTPAMGTEALTKAFIICVMGGLGNIRGTILASYVVAVVELTAAFVLGIYWAPLVLFAFMMIVMVARPSGLLARKER